MKYQLNKLHLLDYNKITKDIEDGFFGTGILDFPYGINESKKAAPRSRDKGSTHVRQKNGSVKVIKRKPYQEHSWDNATPSSYVIKETMRICKNWMFFGANYLANKIGVAEASFKTPRRHEIQDFLKAHPKGWIAWDKCNGSNSFNDYELIYTSFDFDSYVLNYMWHGMMQGKSIKEGRFQRGDKKLNEKRVHPTHKPTLLIRHLLQKYGVSPVADLSCGGGSIPLACLMEGFDFFACDINEEYLKVANKRIGFYKQQLKMTFLK